VEPFVLRLDISPSALRLRTFDDGVFTALFKEEEEDDPNGTFFFPLAFLGTKEFSPRNGALLFVVDRAESPFPILGRLSVDIAFSSLIVTCC